MPCHFDPERLSAYHDGELDAAGREAVEAHVAGCAACRDVLRAFAENDDSVRQVFAVNETLARAIPFDPITGAPPAALPARFGAARAAAAAFVCAAAIGWLVLRTAPPPVARDPAPASVSDETRGLLRTAAAKGGPADGAAAAAPSALPPAAIPAVLGSCEAILIRAGNTGAGDVEEWAGIRSAIASNGVVSQLDAAQATCVNWSDAPSPPGEVAQVLREVQDVLAEVQAVADPGAGAARAREVREKILDRGLVDQCSRLRRQLAEAPPAQETGK